MTTGMACRAARIVIADDAVTLRAALERVLRDAGFALVGSCGDAPSLLALVKDHAPDLAVVDIRMPPTCTDEGFRAAEQIRARWPLVGVGVLTQYREVALARKLLAGGAERWGSCSRKVNRPG